jgi:poly-gamma-glutamate synthesis protein (capsule biosynthesis protein)
LVDVLREADVLHVSDEVSFDPSCPLPRPYRNRFFCSDPRYLGLFESVGVDVVELTGNHILDNGAKSFLYTLDLLTQHHMAYFGGGANLEDARKVLAIDYHGNKLAFLGCIAGEPPQPIATERTPGANPCDYRILTSQIAALRSKGYLPIVTFQYKEGYSPEVMPWQEIDFRKAAAAGAVVVSGSQSHVPMKMEFYNGAFIHYGLGTFFFGQMANHRRGRGRAACERRVPGPPRFYVTLHQHRVVDRHAGRFARPRP